MRKNLSGVLIRKRSKYSEKMFIQIAAVPYVNDVVFLPLSPLAGLAAEWSRDLHPGLHRDVTVTWHTHGQNPQVLRLPMTGKKLLLKWNEDQRPQRGLLSTESGICLQESSAVIPHWAPVTSSSSVKQLPTGQRLLANRGTNQLLLRNRQLSFAPETSVHPGIPPPAATS